MKQKHFIFGFQDLGSSAPRNETESLIKTWNPHNFSYRLCKKYVIDIGFIRIMLFYVYLMCFWKHLILRARLIWKPDG